MSNLQVTDCPFYEECAGEYYQGMWQYTDCCYFSQALDTYKPDCTANKNCWYRRKDCKEEIAQIQNKIENIPAGFSDSMFQSSGENYYVSIIKIMLKELGALQEEE